MNTPNDITPILIGTQPGDLGTLFKFQLDETARLLAAFTPAQHDDKTAYISKFTRLLAEPTVNMFTIWLDSAIVGSIAKFEIESQAEITYWIDRKHWGNGIGTSALKQLLALERMRPIFARLAFDNAASQKVLERCGFVRIGTDRGFANARGEEIQELIYRLDA